ncbi:DUF4198 domain-containing protein [Massilia sp. Dwa41.01b]|uniref:DUF4198 domain-containing protein n=1 Tax=unclassified Massilia TaxID=2609279 RepID=UPI0016022427|nr:MULTISPECIES: DUF4198 domain-containing protein [unclassified Massilia]QNA89814.1 DUF4198 domain-containing protein [Massilia sp. Dwa41.01b]QNB00709.1 DUF4198 domain-containing protein [Massilia sp. Se16.2.3]
MQNSFIKHGVLGLVLLAAAGAASAHRPWMLPTSTIVESKDAWVTIDGAISEGLFDVDHMPLRMDGALVTGPDGNTAPAPAAVMGKMRASIDLPLPKEGTYRIALVSTNVMGSYKVGEEVKRFRASEADFARQVPAGAQDLRKTITHQRIETFVSAHKTNDAALKPTGKGLEMVPLTHPNDLRANETMRVRFLLDGKPLPNLPFSLVPGGVRYRGVAGEIRLTTDAKGEASFKLPAANMYWMNAAYPPNPGKGPAPDNGPAETRRYAYTATLEALPE